MWILLVEQMGEGCDLSICCGRDWIDLRAKTRDQAIGEFKKMLDDRSTIGEDGVEDKFTAKRELGRAILLEVLSREELPVSDYYCDIEYWKQEAAERQEYERLKAKFGA